MIFKKKVIPRTYQEPLVSDIISKFDLGIPYVLGSCPSSGKTEISISVTQRLFDMGLIKNVLVLAHSTNVLKQNFYDRIINYYNTDDVDVMKGQTDFNHNASIQVMIPQNISKIVGEFDMIIVDEAHHNVLVDDGNYSKIVDMVKPKFELYLTGTPSKFIKENDICKSNNEPIKYNINTVGMDMIGFDNFHNVRFDLIKSAYTFGKEDYSDFTNSLKDGLDLDDISTSKTTKSVLEAIVRNVALRNGIPFGEKTNTNKLGREMIKDNVFGKTLVMCNSIKQCNKVSELISIAFNTVVKVSTSENDSESENLNAFKRGEFNFLCVVNRAREGYDDNKVVNLVDMTLTHNIDLIYQMFCRVVRKDETNLSDKLYIKITTNNGNMPKYTMNIMTAALMLASKKNISCFNGNNFGSIIIPKIEFNEDDENDVIGYISDNDEPKSNKKINSLLALQLVELFYMDDETLNNGNYRYSHTTLENVLKSIDGILFLDDKETYFKIMREHNIKSSRSWFKKYKSIVYKDFKLISNPWKFYNQTIKDFFGELNGITNVLYDKETYFDIMREHNITCARIWREKYKTIVYKDFKLHSNPWMVLNMSCKKFFRELNVIPNILYDKETYFDIMREYNIKSEDSWRKKYKTIVYKDLKLLSDPWRLFNQSSKDFFNEICGCKLEEKETYFKIMCEHNITSINLWRKKYKTIDYNGFRIGSNPWRIFNQSGKEFFDEFKNYIKNK